MKKILIGLIAICVVCLPVYAVHKTAAGMECGGCHVMHTSSNAKLLVANTTEGMCLQCHDSGGSQYGDYSTTVPVVMNATGPGIAGDFADMSANDNGDTSSTGNGHNYNNTGAALAIPGSSLGTMNIDCGSCHDAHGSGLADDTGDNSPGAGTVDFYRNLWQQPPDGDGSNADILCSLKDTSLANGGADDYDLSDTSYGKIDPAGGASGFSQWCITCHDNYDGVSALTDDWLVHPVDEDYAEDVGTEDMADFTTSYLAAATDLPLQDVAAGSSANAGPRGDADDDEVFCLTCHKAHGSAYEDGLRWDNSPGATIADDVGCQACHLR